MNLLISNGVPDAIPPTVAITSPAGIPPTAAIIAICTWSMVSPWRAMARRSTSTSR